MDYFSVVGGTVLAFGIGGIFSLSGVVIGGLFVLRTRRDGYEPIVPPFKEKKEETAYNMDDFQETPDSDANVDSVIENIFAQRTKEEDPSVRANNSFKEQMNG